MDILDSSGAMVTKMSCSLIDDIFKNNRKTPEESQRFQKSQRMKKDKQEITTSPNDSSVKIQSWTLEKREAVNLQLPNLVEGASGTVVVIIKVDRQGEVVFAEVDPTVSSINVELKENARKAAKKSKFSVSSDSPIRQTGVIVYYYH
jgi:outer membrane biosynthesis protein TonB